MGRFLNRLAVSEIDRSSLVNLTGLPSFQIDIKRWS